VRWCRESGVTVACGRCCNIVVASLRLCHEVREALHQGLAVLVGSVLGETVVGVLVIYRSTLSSVFPLRLLPTCLQEGGFADRTLDVLCYLILREIVSGGFIAVGRGLCR